MAANYLQYIGSVQQTNNPYMQMRFLVTGTDPIVRRVVGEHIVESAFSRGLPLIIVDNTKEAAGLGNSIGNYRVMNALDDDISLCSNLLDVNTVHNVSRLRSFLSALGFDNRRSMQVISFLKFVRETEARLGNRRPLTAEILEEYGGTMLVEWKLCQLVESGLLTDENKVYLLGRYAEVSAAAADFESALILLAPFMGNNIPSADVAIHFPISELCEDKPMQDVLCKLLVSHIKHEAPKSVVLILDDGNGDGSSIITMLKNIPATTEVHLLSADVFSLNAADCGVLMNKFPVRIYTRHENMESCRKIESFCGEIDVVKHSSTVTVDRRFHANSAWDMLLGTNKSETETVNAPVRDPRFRKEYIQALPLGTGIVDFAGNKVLFSF